MLHFGKIPKKFAYIWRKFSKILAKLAIFGEKKQKKTAILNENFEIRERCKGVHCVDLGESFPTSIYLQNLASMQPRTSPVKFASSSSRNFELELRNFEPLICNPARVSEVLHALPVLCSHAESTP